MRGGSNLSIILCNISYQIPAATIRIDEATLIKKLRRCNKKSYTLSEDLVELF